MHTYDGGRFKNSSVGVVLLDVCVRHHACRIASACLALAPSTEARASSRAVCAVATQSRSSRRSTSRQRGRSEDPLESTYVRDEFGVRGHRGLGDVSRQSANTPVDRYATSHVRLFSS